MADTTVLVAAITGASTAGGSVTAAYLTARQQIQNARHQGDVEREKAEREWRQEALDRRRETYGQLLDVERNLRVLVASDRNFSLREFQEWLASFNRSYNLVVLTGTRQTRDEAEKLFNELGRIDRERIKDPATDDFAVKFRAAYQNHDAKLTAIRDALIEAMRHDVAPV